MSRPDVIPSPVPCRSEEGGQARRARALAAQRDEKPVCLLQVITV
jgi:hypothetical protein